MDSSNFTNNQVLTTVSNDESYLARNSMIYQLGNSSINTSFNPNFNISTENELRRSFNNDRILLKNHLANSFNSMNSSPKMSYNPFLVLKSHFDSVREIYLSPDKNHLISVGEDMVINFWDFKKAIKQIKENHEPYLSLRSHTTPIFTLTGPTEIHHGNDVNIYTSGMDGVIRCTKIPKLNFEKNKCFDDTLTEICLQPWRAHQDMIWDLNYHPIENIMSSVSSDGSVKIFRGYDGLGSDKSYYSFDSRSKNLIRQFTFKNNYYNFIEIPTSSHWSSKSYNNIYVSHIAPYIKLYDVETGKSVCDYNYSVEKNIPFECQQSNKIIFHDAANVLITGHEDRQIRFFDPNQNKIIKSIVAHTDSVSTLSIGLNEYEFLSASHDGSIRCWDMRIFKLLFDIPAHRKKYDEGCLSIKCYPNQKLVITCGADSLIKAFQFSK
jgi:striatin 1/3/4